MCLQEKLCPMDQPRLVKYDADFHKSSVTESGDIDTSIIDILNKPF